MLMDVEQDTWGPSFKKRDLNAKIIFSHQFKECHIVPDGHFALEIVSKAHATAAEITELSKKVLKSITTLTREARWTDKLYSNGERFDYSDMPLLHHIDMLLITEIDACLRNNATYVGTYPPSQKNYPQPMHSLCLILSEICRSSFILSHNKSKTSHE